MQATLEGEGASRAAANVGGHQRMAGRLFEGSRCLDWFCPCRHWASIIYKDRPCPACGAAKPASLVDAAMMAERLASARMHGQMDAVIGAVNPNDAREPSPAAPSTSAPSP